MRLRHKREGVYTITPVDGPDIEVDGHVSFDVDNPAVARSLLEQSDVYSPDDDESKRIAEEIADARAAHDTVVLHDPDDLTVAELLPTLPALSEDELRDLRAKESAGKARQSVLKKIDDLLAPAGDEQE